MKISEIFFSYQAEGLYIGAPTIFIRFSGCNLNCYYCDEKKLKKVKNVKIKSVKDIINFLKNTVTKNKVDFISLTGGEPLIQKGIEDLVNNIILLKKKKKFKIYLETNASMPSVLEKIIKKVDVISLDLKIPLDDKKRKNILKEFKKCVSICQRNKKIYFVKLIVGGKVLYPKSLTYLLKNVIKSLNLKEIILQPVTEDFKGYSKNLFFNLCNIFSIIKKNVPNIYIIPQLHRTIWSIK